MLGQETRLLLLDDGALAGFLLSLKLLLGELGLALLFVNRQLLLPESLDLALVFQFAHAAPLGVHLLQPVILCELLHQLALELFLHAFLLFSPLGLESELVLAGGLELFTDAHAFLSLGSLLGLSGLFALLYIQVVSELLLEGLFGGPLLLLCRQFLEDLVADGLGLLFHRLDFILSGLLLLSVPAHHLVLILVHLALALQQGSLLVLRQNHVSLTLLFLLLDNASLFVVFLDHALNDGIDLLLLSEVLFVGLLARNVGIFNLLLDRALVRLQVLQLLLVLGSLVLVANLLVLEHGDIDLGVLLLTTVKRERVKAMAPTDGTSVAIKLLSYLRCQFGHGIASQSSAGSAPYSNMQP